MLLVFLFLVAAAATQVGGKSVTTSVLRHSQMTRESRIVHEVANGEMMVDYRQAIESEDYRWPGGKIPYKISPEMRTSEEAMKNIKKAVAYWNDNTCVTLYEDPDVTDDVRHLLLRSKSAHACSADIGYNVTSPPEQVVKLKEGCETVSVISHELGHSIGLYHEQSRSDFSQAVKVYFENILKKDKFNFKLKSGVTNFDLPFDYGSIMEYGPDDFSKNGRLTLVPSQPLQIALMGLSSPPDFQDFELVNIMYKCTDKCSDGPKCSNGGYTAWNEKKSCRCMCPPGWTGDNCEQEAPAEKLCLFNVTSAPYTLTSIHFPETAGPSVGCAWMVTPPEGKAVQVKFTTFQMDDRAENGKCAFDHFRVRSGDLMSDDPGKIYCAKELENKGFKIDGPILMEFRTNSDTDADRKFNGRITFV